MIEANTHGNRKCQNKNEGTHSAENTQIHYFISEYFFFFLNVVLMRFCLLQTLNLRETSDVSLKWAVLLVKVWGFAAFRPSKGSNRCSGSFPQRALQLSSTQPSLLYTCKAPQEGGWCVVFAAHNWTACVYSLPRTISGLAVVLWRALACGDFQNGACCHVITHGVFTSLLMDGWAAASLYTTTGEAHQCAMVAFSLTTWLIEESNAFIHPPLGKLASLQQHVAQ